MRLFTLFLILIISASGSAKAFMPQPERPDYCSPFFTGVNRVYINFNPIIPYEGVNWEKVMKYFSKRSMVALEENNITR